MIIYASSALDCINVIQYTFDITNRISEWQPIPKNNIIHPDFILNPGMRTKREKILLNLRFSACIYCNGFWTYGLIFLVMIHMKLDNEATNYLTICLNFLISKKDNTAYEVCFCFFFALLDVKDRLT